MMRTKYILLMALLALGTARAGGQNASPSDHQIPPLTERGEVEVGGVKKPFVIRRLPVSSFPSLPNEVQEQLNERGCMIPQTYQAHRPENVVHASLERAGSSDWAVLCAARGTVSLLVFFGSALDKPMQLVSAPETERLETHDPTGVLGFNWGIDPASPGRVHDAQAGMDHRPPLGDHDALGDSVIDQHTVYRYYTGGMWVQLDMPD
jgi:hypothetical protein